LPLFRGVCFFFTPSVSTGAGPRFSITPTNKESAMKTMALSALLLLAVGCAGSSSPGDTANSKPVPTDDAQDQSAEPAVDPAASGDCSTEISLTCEAGMVDGCSIRDDAGEALTSYHICVPQGETHEGTPCEQEIWRECGEGLIDACGLQPAAAKIHACVQKPAEASDATEPPPPEEPQGEEE
jgi:hypothetical protein